MLLGTVAYLGPLWQWGSLYQYSLSTHPLVVGQGRSEPSGWWRTPSGSYSSATDAEQQHRSIEQSLRAPGKNKSPGCLVKTFLRRLCWNVQHTLPTTQQQWSMCSFFYPKQQQFVKIIFSPKLKGLNGKMAQLVYWHAANTNMKSSKAIYYPFIKSIWHDKRHVIGDLSSQPLHYAWCSPRAEK